MKNYLAPFSSAPVVNKLAEAAAAPFTPAPSLASLTPEMRNRLIEAVLSAPATNALAPFAPVVPAPRALDPAVRQMLADVLMGRPVTLSHELKKAAAWANTAKHPLDPSLGWNGERWVKEDQYGKDSDTGWEVDHVRPKELGGTDHPANLMARHPHENRGAGADLANLLRRLK